MNGNLLHIEIRYEQDVVLTRQRARQISALLGFSSPEQTGIATSVSELARNAFRYAGGGRVAFSVRTTERPALIVRVQDTGKGIADLRSILEGRYKSTTGMGLGIIGSKRLNDEFDIQSKPGEGTVVTVAKWLPRNAPPVTPSLISELSANLAQRSPRNALEEMQDQNKELLEALDALRLRQAEVERLNSELAETNRGVVALYAELDDKAEALRKASEYKSRFLSDMTHELRTPLNAMVSLSRLLLSRVDGELSVEQEKQVTLINRSALSLGEMVNDLLDLAKIEAGKTEVHVTEFHVADVMAALRGMFRPLVGETKVNLQFEDVNEPFRIRTDERKLSQILRNFISNAMKFTEAGEIVVSARSTEAGAAEFSVADTGIGIAPENLDRIFEDFTQIDSGLQRRVRGTGLGLPLTKKFARLLGGDVTVHSAWQKGSTFVLTLPDVVVATDSTSTSSEIHAGEEAPRG